jgi:hypothetical protein
MNPRNISLIEELMKVFEKQGLIVDFKLKNTKSTFRFRKANKIPGNLRRRFGINVNTSP